MKKILLFMLLSKAGFSQKIIIDQATNVNEVVDVMVGPQRFNIGDSAVLNPKLIPGKHYRLLIRSNGKDLVKVFTDGRIEASDTSAALHQAILALCSLYDPKKYSK